MQTVSFTKEKKTPENPANAYFLKSDAGGAGNVNFLYANMMIVLTKYINQHTLAQDKKALQRQALLSI